jgi:hypothetical protein
MIAHDKRWFILKDKYEFIANGLPGERVSTLRRNGVNINRI